MPGPIATIETTHYRGEGRTLWLLKCDGEIVKVGETDSDATGIAAFEAATEWAKATGYEVGPWKHWTTSTSNE